MLLQRYACPFERPLVVLLIVLIRGVTNAFTHLNFSLAPPRSACLPANRASLSGDPIALSLHVHCMLVIILLVFALLVGVQGHPSMEIIQGDAAENEPAAAHPLRFLLWRV